MTYVVTFEDCDRCECYIVNASCVEIAVMDAKERVNEECGYHKYSDCDVISVIRI